MCPTRDCKHLIMAQPFVTMTSGIHSQLLPGLSMWLWTWRWSKCSLMKPNGDIHVRDSMQCDEQHWSGIYFYSISMPVQLGHCTGCGNESQLSANHGYVGYVLLSWKGLSDVIMSSFLALDGILIHDMTADLMDLEEFIDSNVPSNGRTTAKYCSDCFCTQFRQSRECTIAASCPGISSVLMWSCCWDGNHHAFAVSRCGMRIDVLGLVLRVCWLTLPSSEEPLVLSS